MPDPRTKRAPRPARAADAPIVLEPEVDAEFCLIQMKEAIMRQVVMIDRVLLLLARSRQ